MTPTSAKIAAHMLVIPRAPRIRQANFTTRAKTMFWYTIRRHFFDIFIALEIFIGSSSIRTTSAASIAASEPKAPMAMPMSALVSTGASLIPSPAKASFPLPSARSISTMATLSAGSSSLWTSSIPSSPATLSAMTFESPVSMTVLATPACLSAQMAAPEVGLTTSEITM